MANIKTTAFYAEEDTNIFIAAVTDGTNFNIYKEWVYGSSGRTDGFTGNGTDGYAIPFIAQTGYFNFGDASIQKIFTSVVLEYECPTGDTLFMDILYNLSTTATETYTLTPGTGRLRQPIPFGQSGGFSTGHEAYCVGFRFYGTSKTGVKLCSMTFDYYVLTATQRGKISDWNDLGTPYEKRLKTFTVEFDTRGTAYTLNMDTMTVSPTGTSQNLAVQSFTINSNGRSKQTFPINGDVVCKMVRLRPTVSNSDVLIFNYDFDKIAYPADASFNEEWDSVDYPYDKLLHSIYVESDTRGVASTWHLDTISGLNGNTVNLGVATIVLHSAGASSGRAMQQFPLPKDTIAKMVRLRPAVYAQDVTVFKYSFDKTNYPADIMLSTNWTEMEYKCEKICRSVTMDVDTGGVPATFTVEYSNQNGDILTAGPFIINTTFNSRVRTFSFEQNLIGYAFRTAHVPGYGGKFQIFTQPQFDHTNEPCPLTFWDSLEVYSGSAGYRLFKQMWIQYRTAGNIIVNIYRDGGALMYSGVFGPQLYRDTIRLFPYMYVASYPLNILNKSQRYRITITSEDGVTPFYLYRDSSRMELLNISGDQRNGYYQTVLFSQLPLPI